jgi:hypothetical protein
MNLEDLEKRVGILEDIEQIKQLQTRYVNYLITNQWDALLDLFDDDGAVELESYGLHKGKAALEKEFKERVALGHNGHEGDYIVHPLITIDGDRARGSWLLYLQKQYPYKRTDGADIDWTQGFYEAAYVKKNGKWKISLLKFNARLSSPRPSRDALNQGNGTTF